MLTQWASIVADAVKNVQWFWLLIFGREVTSSKPNYVPQAINFAASMKISTLRILMISSIVLLPLTGCDGYQKLLKSTDTELKYEKAMAFYAEDRCMQALPILKELVGLFRGTDQMEEVFFAYAGAQYCIEDWYMARYYYRQYAKTFASSEHTEEAEFRAALCSVYLSPSYSLDQFDTGAAIDDLQLFMDRYPQSSLKDSCNNMMGRLRGKLELKSFEQAKLYHTTQKFQSAVMALDYFLDDHPMGPYSEEASFLIIESQFLYAQQSTLRRREERFADAIESYFNFAARFPESDFIDAAVRMHRQSMIGMEKASKDMRVNQRENPTP